MAFRTILRCAAVLAALAAPALETSEAAAIETTARTALLVDYETGAVLLEKNADTPMPPASMSKIMTVYMAFERIRDGRLKMDDVIPISEKAWRKGGSRMFVEVNTRVRIDDILRGIIVQSGNDAAVALAEALAGSEEAFAAEMNERARELGMTGSTFRNSTGWPDPEHRISARDLARLSSLTIRNFPELYELYAEASFTYNRIQQGNRNPLLRRTKGADGLKTGYTSAAGYGLTGSVQRDGRRLILVVNGLSSARRRAREAETIIEWGFREFDNYRLLKAGQVVETGAVWLGSEPEVPLALAEDLLLTLERRQRAGLEVSVVLAEPIPAPISKGQRVATLRVSAPEMEPIELPLLAQRDVAELGVLKRVVSAVGYLLWGPGG